MRDPNRIDPFMEELAHIWKTKCPDWRFGQFIFNIFDSLGGMGYHMEEDSLMKYIKKYFDIKEEKK